MNEQNTPVRPLCLELEEAKAEIFSVINMTAQKHNLPFYLLESIISDAARQTAEAAKKERETAERDYERQLAEFNKQKGE